MPAKSGRRTEVAKKDKCINADPITTCERFASKVTTLSTAGNTSRAVPTTLAAAVNSALKVPRQQPYRYLLAAALISTSAVAQAQGFPASFSPLDLDGSNGFVINGINEFDYSGFSVSSAGDINGDGVNDIIISAPEADVNGVGIAGESYVVFGGTDVGNSGSLNPSTLDGSNGFTIRGIGMFDRSGYSVSSAGDINGDGVDDVIIGANGVTVDGLNNVGASYVVFGGSGVGGGGSLNLSDLAGINGFVINGLEEEGGFGVSVSGAGDVNDDGVDDVIIGTNGRDVNVGSYVVFGSSDIGSAGSIDASDLDGNNGFGITGINELDFSNLSVSGAGDINGDGVDDVIIGAGNSVRSAGESYVVFGGRSVGSGGVLNVLGLDGGDGFVINGIDEDDRAGTWVSDAGDINGDGVDDFIIGADGGDPNGVSDAGESYVVFGGNNIGGGGSLNLSTLNGINGFVINGTNEFDRSGLSVSGAGDINGDGIDDVIITSINFTFDETPRTGESHVVFGGASVDDSGSLNLSDLDGNNGFEFTGFNFLSSKAITSVSNAGDINGDGIADVIIGSASATPNGVRFGGESYVVFGISDTPVTPSPDGPDNDQFENARFLDSADKALVSELTLTVNGTTVNATAQSGEPAHFQGGFGLPPGPDNSIWYRWTPEADQVVEVDTAGSAVSTVLVAYTGASLSGLQRIATGIDNVREVARIRFAVRAGETYHLAVDGYEEISQGSIQLNLRQPRLDPSECTIKGTNGSDSLVGTPGPDVICALDGDDFIKALGGDDIIFAGPGSDFISADGDNDIVFGEEGNDVITGASGDDVIIGGPGNDQLAGANGDDIVFGGTGADRLSGSGGNDELFGESDEDRLIGGTGDDYLDGGSFKDICVDSEGEDTLVSC